MNKYRPNYHISPKKGWINDPNGFVYFNNQFHVYAQHNPKDVCWGPMHWLHFVSEDLINWKQCEISLYPDQVYDCDLGCFSGSSIVYDNKIYALYTGVANGKQRQCLAISEDGYTYKKYEHNPIIDERHLPNGYLVSDFRDPKVFEINNKYYVLCVCRNENNYSSILLFESEDLINYRFVNVLKSFYDLKKGGMVECPEIIFKDGKCALIYSLQNPTTKGDLYQNSFVVGYQIGTLDVNKGIFTPIGPEREIDKGFDSYALQVIEKDNEFYSVSWMSSWGINYPSKKEGYAGQLSLIKKIIFDDDKLKYQFLENQNTKIIKGKLINDEATIKVNNVLIDFDKAHQTITISRKNMEVQSIDEDGVIIDSRTFHLSFNEEIKVEYHLDNSCLEISINDGDAFFSMINYYHYDDVNVVVNNLK